MDLFPVTKEERKQILKQYNVTEAEVEDGVKTIKIWKEKVQHLPTNITDDFIARVLLKNKFRVEHTKEKLDNYFTLRGQNQDLIYGLENIVPSKHLGLCMPMSKLTPNLERVVILKLLNTNSDIYDAEEYFKFIVAIAELSLQYDDSIGTRYIFDFEGFSLKHLVKFNPVLLAKLFTFIQVKIYSDIKPLYDIIPKECLPSEYGGSCRQWDEAFKNHKSFFIENYNNVALEHLRPEDMKTSDAFGPDGTFKKLTVD
ncbi:uncharacterized protein LOC135123829 [Zophobas morio]|uniref:uncharacterized protein LOC135123829 n=1 Tax=Zophobas morio TaxID=2755281 RepID=UPI0030828F5D